MTKHRSEMLLLATALIVLSVIVAFQAFDEKPLFPEQSSIAETAKVQTTVKNEKNTNGQKNSNNSDAFPINLNAATIEQLCTVSGIGEAKAQAIIDYRQAVGGFISVDELLNVKGIGDATFNKIKGAFVV